NSPDEKHCISEYVGYPCCPPDVTDIFAQDENGDWGFDFEQDNWCGLTPVEENPPEEEKHTDDVEECWSEYLGYGCCVGCIVYEVDNSGSWGYENDKWCGI
ncbi:Non-catalytic module family DOC2, partial [Piromyces sp. E2]